MLCNQDQASRRHPHLTASPSTAPSHHRVLYPYRSVLASSLQRRRRRHQHRRRRRRAEKRTDLQHPHHPTSSIQATIQQPWRPTTPPQHHPSPHQWRRRHPHQPAPNHRRGAWPKGAAPRTSARASAHTPVNRSSYWPTSKDRPPGAPFISTLMILTKKDLISIVLIKTQTREPSHFLFPCVGDPYGGGVVFAYQSAAPSPKQSGSLMDIFFRERCMFGFYFLTSSLYCCMSWTLFFFSFLCSIMS